MLPVKIKKGNAPESSILRKLFINELKTIYWVEKQMLKLLPRLTKAATTGYLKAGFKGHLYATEEHVKRLEKVFKLLNEQKAAKKCELINSIVLEAKKNIKITQNKTLARELELLSVAQKIERYETKAYRKLIRFANIFGHPETELILAETLIEEIEAEEAFIAIEEDTLNDDLFKVQEEITEDEF